MIQTYKVTEETDQQVTYQYNTICSWWVYSCLGMIITTILTDIVYFAVAGTLGLIVYMATAYLPAIRVAQSIRSSMKAGSVKLSGSRWSFEHPLTIVVPKYMNEAADG